MLQLCYSFNAASGNSQCLPPLLSRSNTIIRTIYERRPALVLVDLGNDLELLAPLCVILVLVLLVQIQQRLCQQS